MVAKGRDASDLYVRVCIYYIIFKQLLIFSRFYHISHYHFRFPAVVKNVVSKNIEVKKLVYVYLERYAEEQQDLALLSISTFQRALKV